VSGGQWQHPYKANFNRLPELWQPKPKNRSSTYETGNSVQTNETGSVQKIPEDGPVYKEKR
jgi:hypothetical protein